MPTIFQYKALSNIFEAAKLKYPVNKFDSIDRELFSMGVRVGQIWSVVMPGTEEIRVLSFLGYHEKGFLFLQMRDGDSSFGMGNNPVITKKEILKSLRGEATSASAIKTPPVTLLDDNGMPLPGNEIDVMMHGMGLEECTWLSPISGKHKYLYTCKNGHFIHSDRLPNDFIVECGPECWESKSDPELMFYIDNKIGNIINGKFMRIDSPRIRSINPLCQNSFNPYSVELRKCKEIFSNIPRAIANDGPLHKTENLFNGDIRVTTEALKDKGIRSGDTFIVNTNPDIRNNQKLYAKIHFRECGATHIEFSMNKIFTGLLDRDIVNILTSSNEVRIQINRLKSITIVEGNNSCIAKCPVCRTPNEFILRARAQEITFRTKKTVDLSKRKKDEDKEVLSVGSFVLFKKKPAVIHKLITTPNGLERAIVLDQKSKLSSTRPKLLKQIRPTANIIRTFYDKNNILKKKTSPEKWHELILQGSRLRVRENITDIDKKYYAGKVVTVMGTPMRLSDTEWGVNVVEVEEIFNLNKELSLTEATQLYRGMVLKEGDKELTIDKVENGYITFAEDGRKVPESAIQLMMERNQITQKMIYTAESLL